MRLIEAKRDTQEKGIKKESPFSPSLKEGQSKLRNCTKE